MTKTFDQLSHFEKIESYIPIDLISFEGAVVGFLFLFFVVSFRYFLISAPLYFLLWKSDLMKTSAVHNLRIKPGQIKSEIKWSLIASFIFAFTALVTGVLWQQGYTKIYVVFSSQDWWYVPLSFSTLLVVHELYFYFTHVWMHQPRVFKAVHQIHHRSVKPSPFASFSFHPYETLVHAAFLPVMVLILPLHPLTLIAYMTLMTLAAVSNHSGFEVLHPKFLRKFLISGEHHNAHHKHYTCNFGLYFCLIDQIFKTEKESPA